MKTNRFYGIITMLALVLGTLLVFSSCSKDNDDSSSVGSSGSASVVDELQKYAWHWSDMTVDDLSVTKNYWTIYFFSKTGGCIAYTDVWDDEDGHESSRGNQFFTYTVNGNNIHIDYNDDDYTLDFVYNGKSISNSGMRLDRRELDSEEVEMIAEYAQKEIESNTQHSLTGKTYQIAKEWYRHSSYNVSFIYTLRFTSATTCTINVNAFGYTKYDNQTVQTSYTLRGNKLTINGCYPIPNEYRGFVDEVWTATVAYDEKMIYEYDDMYNPDSWWVLKS